MAGGDPVDVFGHSYGAVCALGAASPGAPVRRLALYEPPGPPTVPAPWRAQPRESEALSTVDLPALAATSELLLTQLTSFFS
jgi:pimeloyl-ACP methyl ester carboxylesterase